MARTIEQIQQDFANNSCLGQEVIWDLLAADQGDILKKKIKELIPDAKTGQKTLNEMREAIFNNVWSQRKYTNNNSLSSIIYVMVTKIKDFDKARESKNFSCHPVIRTRKCIDKNDSSACCMIFVDEVGRVYRNWECYVKENVLPMGTMIAPHRGIYNVDAVGRVKLDIYETPASSILGQVLTVADTTSAIAGIGAASVPIAALCAFPVAAPVMASAAIVGLSTAFYSTLRSGSNLFERSQHEQSISLTDRQARGSWLTVVAGIIGIGASGATRAMTTAASAGREVSVVTEMVVNGMNISSIVLSGTGLGNGVLDLILKSLDDEKITLLDVVQLSASLVLFTHSVNNFRMASNLINETRNGSIQNYRDGLSNRQRRIFTKMSKETIRMRGETQGKIDIIRNINDIPSKQYLNDLHKINSNLNKQSVRPAFAGNNDVGVVLNNEVKVDTQVLRNNVQHNIGPNLLGEVSQPIPSSHNTATVSTETRILFANSSSVSYATKTIKNYITNSILAPNFAVIFNNVINEESFQDVIESISERFGERVFCFIMNLTRKFIETKMDNIQRIVRTAIPSETILYKIFIYCWEHYQHLPYEFLITKSEEIMKYLCDCFNSLNTNNCAMFKKCEYCTGEFSICEL